MALAKITEFGRSVLQEAKKITWPPRKEVGISTLMIVVMIVVVSVFLLVVDLILSGAVRWFLGLAG